MSFDRLMIVWRRCGGIFDFPGGDLTAYLLGWFRSMPGRCRPFDVRVFDQSGPVLLPAGHPFLLAYFAPEALTA